MPSIPRERTFDSSLALLHEPYDFISSRCRTFGSDVFETRLRLRKTLCLTGRDAAALFYDPQRFMRAGAAPTRLQQSLGGVDGVQSLDGEAHAHRKAMFMSLMGAEHIRELAAFFAGNLHTAARKWPSMPRVVLYDELHEPLARSACEWAGVPLLHDQIARRSRELTTVYDRAGAVGPPHWWSRMERNLTEHWCAELIQSIRRGELSPSRETAAHCVAFHRDLNGEVLPLHTAAVELLNVLRPIVAISVYIVFLAHALHLHPGARSRIAQGDAQYARWFVQEVRRFYPFFPTVVARVREEFEWRDFLFPSGVRTLLDLHGVNHDPRLWEEPDVFEPERFASWDESAYNFIPQGGGDHSHGHRCAGEWATIELMLVALDFLTREVSYSAPAQDLQIDMARLPALPKSRYVMTDVRLTR